MELTPHGVHTSQYCKQSFLLTLLTEQADRLTACSMQGRSAASQQPSSSSETADALHDVSLIDDLAEAYAANPNLAENTADFTFAAGCGGKETAL